MIIKGVEMPDPTRKYDRTICEYLNHLHAVNRRYAIYGSGRWGRRILDLAVSNGYSMPVMVLDDNPSSDNIAGIPLRKPSESLLGSFDEIVLGTDTYQMQMKSKITSIFGDSIHVADILKELNGILVSCDNRLFVNPALSIDNMDIYVARTAILKALKENIKYFKGHLLDVGCGQMPYRELIMEEAVLLDKYTGLDLEKSSIYSYKVDLVWNGKSIPLGDSSVDTVMLTEVMEHCDAPLELFKEICRVLKPGGMLFFTVPYLWPLHDVPYDMYRYTPFAIDILLKKSGFENVELKKLGGWNSSMAQMLGLYLKRSSMGSFKRKFLSWVLFPFYRILAKKDIEAGSDIFAENTMFTGLYGRAFKLGNPKEQGEK